MLSTAWRGGGAFAMQSIAYVREDDGDELVAGVFLQLVALPQRPPVVRGVAVVLNWPADFDPDGSDIGALQPRNRFKDALRGRIGWCGVRNETSAGVGTREHRRRPGDL